MGIIRTEIEGAEVIIESAYLKPRARGGMIDAAGAMELDKKINGIFEKMKPILKGIAEKGSEALDILPRAKEIPAEVKIGFCMGYSAELDAWVLKGDTSLTFNIEMKWKLKKDE